MTAQTAHIQPFSYEAQTAEGQRLSGTLEARDAQEAMVRLEAMGLRVFELQPARAAPAPRRPLRADDLLAFNEQLAQLTKAGFPVERGLRLMAADLRHGRLAAAIAEVAGELERGAPLAEAFERHRGRFPSLYGRLIDAGVRSGSLSEILLNLGRHMQMKQRLTATLWRGVSYPLVAAFGLLLVLLFLSLVVFPRFDVIFRDFHLELPLLTRALIAYAHVIPIVVAAILAAGAAAYLAWWAARARGTEGAFAERLALALPMIGSVLKRSLVARWCDAARIGVSAGMDLPSAIDLAADATGSPSLRRDGAALCASLEQGRPLTESERGRVLPGIAVAAIEFASSRHNLPLTLGTLSDMYSRQAELRIERIPAVLLPLLILLIGAVVAIVVLAMVLPWVALLRLMMGAC